MPWKDTTIMEQKIEFIIIGLIEMIDPRSKVIKEIAENLFCGKTFLKRN